MIVLDNINLVQSILIGNWKLYKLTKIKLQGYSVLQLVFWKYLAVILPPINELTWSDVQKYVKQAPGYKKLTDNDQKLIKNLSHDLNLECCKRIKKFQLSLGIKATPESITWHTKPKTKKYHQAFELFKDKTNKITQSLALLQVTELRQLADVMMYSCYPFIRHYCKKVNVSSYNFGAPLEDRFQYTSIGFLASTMTWSGAKNAKFPTYALFNGRSIASKSDVDNHMWLNFNAGFVQECKNLTRDANITRVRISYENPDYDYFKLESEVRKELKKQHSKITTVTAVLGHSFEYEDCDATIEEVELVEDMYDFDKFSIIDHTETPEERLYYEQRSTAIEYIFALLTPRESQILEMRYYLMFTLQKVAESLNITRERARQIEAKALRKLRQGTRNRLLKSFVSDNSSCVDGELKEQYHKDDVQDYLKYHHQAMIDLGFDCEKLVDLIPLLQSEELEISKLEVISRIHRKIAPFYHSDPESVSLYLDLVESLEGTINFPSELSVFINSQLGENTPLDIYQSLRTFKNNPGLFFNIFG
jgi:RNA polymerase sigma factor (sigma-70 family)